MNRPTNVPNRAWMDAVAVILAASIGAAFLTYTSNNNTPVAPAIPQRIQTPSPSPLSPPPINRQYTRKVMLVTPIVKAALLKDDTLYPCNNPALNMINVDTDSEGATIVLKGTVQTEAMKELAGEIAKNAPVGASYKVDNQLTIRKR